MKNGMAKRLFALALTITMLMENVPVMALRAYADEINTVVSQEEQPESQEEQPETPASQPEVPTQGPEVPTSEPEVPTSEPEVPTSEPEEPDDKTPSDSDEEEDLTEEDTKLVSVELAPSESGKAQKANNSFTLLINGEEAGKRTVFYGEPLTFSLGGHTTGEEVNFLYATEENAEKGNWLPIVNGNCSLEPGFYRLIYSVNIDDENISDNSFSISVEKGEVGAPFGLTWSGSQMTWSAPVETSLGGPLDSGVIEGYSVQVFKDGSEFGAPFRTNADTTKYENFSNNIKDTGGAGVYTFTVQAIVAEGHPHYSGSIASSSSPAYTVPSVTIQAGSGIGRITPESSFLLLPGNGMYNSQSVTAEVLENYEFSGWTGEGVSFGNPNSTNTTVTINSDYVGGTSLTLQANARDQVPPEVMDLSGGNGQLQASASDSQSGITEYAFSTQEKAENVMQWQVVAAPAAGQSEFTYTPSAGGVYYFHVKDAGGNTASSSQGIQVTQVLLKDYNHVDDEKDTTVFLVAGHRTLPTPVCPGYVFSGWYEQEDFSGSSVTEPAHSTSGSLTFYARWTEETLSVPALSNISQVYDGQNHTLSVSLNNTGRLTYQWYKDDTEIEGATGNSYTVRNVSDSGKYSVKVKLFNKNNVCLKEGSASAEVTITKRPVVIRAQETTIFYGDALPVFQPEYAPVVQDGVQQSDSGLVPNDEASITGSFSCSYRQWDNQGSYDVTAVDFSSGNYEITTETGTLVVSPRPYTDGVEVKILYDKEGENWFLYTGEEITPALRIVDTKRGNQELSEKTDYTVTFRDNVQVSADKPCAVVTFTGNYQGVSTQHFEIRRADFTAVTKMENWIYGDKAADPVVEGNISQGEVRYQYQQIKDSQGNDVVGAPETTLRPVDAGTYRVTATIAGNDNYLPVTAEPCEFTIARREITITSATAEFSFDGLPHSDREYTVTGTFAPGEGFSYITITGEQTDVTEGADNTLEYGLNSATKPENYNIHIVCGKLIVKSLKLTVPANAGWRDGDPGMASWVAVSKEGLTAQYRLQLYGRIGEDYTAVGQPVVTTDTQWDFADAIRADAANHKGSTYFFTIQTESTGENAANYSPSDTSDRIGSIFTVYVKAVGNDHAENAKLCLVGTNDYVNELVLLQGESALLSAEPRDGYRVSGWEIGEGLQEVANGIRAQLTASVAQSTVTVKTVDIAPQITSYEAVNTDGFKVRLQFTLTDSVGLAGWMIKNDETLPTVNDEGWNLITGREYEGSCDPSAAGKYYLFVKDTVGNITAAPVPTEVNVITLKPGQEGTGDDFVIFKAANTVISLPKAADCGFTADGFGFRNWYSDSGQIYEDGGKYSENKNDTLTASWTNTQFVYTARYFYMDAEGNYPAEPSETGNFHALYGTEISVSTEGIQRSRTGFQLDKSDGHDGKITVKQDHMTIDVYYARCQYTLTFRYTLPGAQEETTAAHAFRYGQELTDDFLDGQKPSVEGYSFVGWNFGTSGSKLSAMPAADVTATGKFIAGQSTVHLRLYIQNLEDDGYSLITSRDIYRVHGEELLISTDLAEKLEGFTYYGACAGKQNLGTTAKMPEDVAADFHGTAADGLFLNLFYTRNTYTITLNVWQGTVGKGDPKYSKQWQYPYEANLLTGEVTAEAMETFEKDTWPHDDAYILASFVDWSTGERPEKMPAGDVTITRQFVLQTTGQYQVEVWTEGQTDNQYEGHTYTFYGNVATDVTVGAGSDYTVDYTAFKSAIPDFEYYDYKDVSQEDFAAGKVQGTGLAGGTKTVGTVTDTNNGEAPLVLRIFLERRVMEAAITYYAQESDGSSKEIAKVTKRCKWGHDFNYEPTALFDTEPGGKWNTQNASSYIVGNADTFDYRNKFYVVSYAGYYQLNDAGHWPGGTLNSVESLSGSYSGPMGVKNTYMNVYYTQVDTQKQYYLDVVYNAGNLSHGENKAVPLTYTYGGEAYKIRVANEAYFYDSVEYKFDGQYADYPGLGYYNLSNGQDGAAGRFVYDTANLKSEFTKIDDTHYLGTDGYLYIADKTNRFYSGHRASYAFPETEWGYQSVTDFLNGYKQAHLDDPYAQGAYVYNRSWGSAISYRDSTLTITFQNGNVFHVYYSVNGTVCRDEAHTYPAGTRVETIGCSHDLFKPLAGYHIAWYDKNGNPAGPIDRLTGDVTFYGQYEKSDITSREYAYFELADHAYKDGGEVEYITAENLVLFGDSITSSEENGVTSYFYEGSMVMQSWEVSSKSFGELTMTPVDYSSQGLGYDASHPGNRLKGYVQTEGIELCAYYKRNAHTFTMDLGIPDADTASSTVRYGQHVNLEVPAREGYLFKGWTILGENGTPVPEDLIRDENGTTVLTIPDMDVKAEANWQADWYDQTILHYFQNSSLGYDTALVAQMRDGVGTEEVIDGVTYLKYPNGGYSRAANSEIFYYAEDPRLPENLCAIEVTQSVLQDTEAAVRPRSAEYYAFAYAVRRSLKGEILHLSENETYTNDIGSSLECYYALQGGYTLTLKAQERSGQVPQGVTLSGGGTYYYSETATATIALPAGYDFVGWYREDGNLEGDPVSGNQTFQITIRENSSYIAVIEKKAVSGVSLSVQGTEELTFGYPASRENSLTVSVQFPENVDPVNYVKAYQWYLRDDQNNAVPVENGASAVLLIPQGLIAGQYRFYCDVTIARKDNGAELVHHSPDHTLTVLPANIPVECKSYAGVYDAAAHSIQLSIASSADFQVYYAEEVLTAENYREKGSIKNPSFTNAGSYKVFYYITNADENYNDAAGFGTVEITAKQLTIRAGSTVYHRTYDGTAGVSGSAADANTDLGRLAQTRGIYTIVGLAGSDAMGSLVISGDAQFNDSHVSTANKLDLRNLKLVDSSTGEENKNYSFASDYQITLSAYIDRLPLNLTWSNTSLPYNAGEQCPDAAIHTALPKTDEGNLSVTVTGAQVNAGQYTASAKLSVTGDSDINDFFLANGSTTYNIAPLKITISPVANATPVTYDGAEHTLQNFVVSQGSLLENQRFHAASNTTAKTVGTHVITACNAHIFDKQGVDVTDNYQVSYGAAELTIEKRTVTVSNLQSADKPYDGSVNAAVVCGNVVFDNKIEGDELLLDSRRISAAFGDANVGMDKTVTFSILENALTGNAAENYVLDVAGSTLTAKASITAKVITVKAVDTSTTYGEEAPFRVTYSGFVDGEDESVIGGTNSIAYKIKTDSTDPAAYDTDTPAGTYTICVEVGGLSAKNGNYSFTGETGVLTVAKRPVTVAAVADAAITKSYDGNVNAVVGADQYAFAVSDGTTASGVVNNDSIGLTYTAAFNSKNVDEANSVTLSGLSMDNPNYELKTDSFQISGSKITPVELAVRADDKEITYGSACPTFTFTASGFVNGETVAVLNTTNAKYSTEYDPETIGKREVKKYKIYVQDLIAEHGNYKLQYEDGTLEVQPATITITAKTSKATAIYGSEPIPEITFSYSGLQYGEKYADVVQGQVSYNLGGLTQTRVGDKLVIDSVPTTYTITPVVTDLSAQNYRFKPVGAQLVVDKFNLAISGVTINPRVYDGTVNIYQNQINLDNVTGDGLMDKDREVFEKDKASLIKITGSYDSKDAGDNRNAEIKIEFLDYLNERCYVDAGSQKTVENIVITKRPVKIIAQNKKILYGQPVPTYTVEYAATGDAQNSGLVDRETADESHVTLQCDYQGETGKFSNAGTYSIVVKDFRGSDAVLLNNYDPSYQEGLLTVEQARLAAPKVSWDDETPGLVKWEPVTGIGDVAVESYTAVLWKDDQEVSGSEKTVMAGNALQKNYADVIRGKGPGRYEVKVTANASAENNPDSKNVAGSQPGTSGALYAAEVSVRFAGADGGTSITVNGVDKYTMIAGEKDIPIRAELKNGTGYTVASVVSDSTFLTITGHSDSQRNGNIYEDTIALSRQLNRADPICITLTLSSTAAEMDVVVTPRPGEDQASCEYGYSEGPMLTAKVTHKDNSTEYTYTYRWEIYYEYTIKAFEEHSGKSVSTDTWRIPTGLRANLNTKYYMVRCIVTAKRNDNGNFCTNENVWVTDYDYVTNITVKRASFSAGVQMDNWNYGGKRAEPQLVKETVTDNEKINGKLYTFLYKLKSAANVPENWSSIFPTDAGEYQMKASIPAAANYKAFDTEPVDFTIGKAKLGTPDQLGMAPSATAPYGLISWGAVDGVKENGGDDSKSEATVSYQVKLYKNGAAEAVKVYDNLNSCELDITDDLQTGGTYDYTVTAISSNPDNCSHSDESGRFHITMTGTISVTETDKLYDGQAITMTAQGDTAVSYQWYKGSEILTGQTSQTLDAVHVADSGTYTCVITASDGTVYTPKSTVTIRPRSVVMTSADGEKVYDGTALENHQVTVSGDGFATGEGAAYSFTGSRTDAGHSSNGFTYQLTGQTTASDYAIANPVFGTLTVKARPLSDQQDSGFTFGTVADVVYNGAAFTPKPEAKDNGLAQGVGEKTLVAGTDFDYTYANNVNAGMATVTISGKGNYIGSVDILFKIGKRPVTFVGETSTVTYDGSKKELNGIAVRGKDGNEPDENSGLAESHVFTASYSAKGTEADTYQGIFGTVTITADGQDVTQNYSVQTKPGTLTIQETDADWTVTLEDTTTTYTGLEQASTKHPVSQAASGTTSYTYSFEEDGNYVSDLSSLKKTNAGTYTIYVKATNPNYQKQATYTSKLVIGKATYTVETYGAEREYNGTPLTAGGRIVGLVNGETATLVCKGSITDASEVDNTYTLTWNGTAVESNYTHGTDTIGKLKVTKNSKDLTVSGTDYSGTYDGKMHGEAAKANVTAGTTIFYSTDGGTTWSGDYPTVRDVASVTVQVKAEHNNYVTATNSYTLNVTPAPYTVETYGAQREYNGTPLTASGRIVGLVNGETATLTCTGSITDASEVDNTYTLTWNGTAVESNYAHGTDTIGKLKVTKNSKDLTVSGTDYSGTYDGKTHGEAATATVTGANISYSTDGGTTWSGDYPTVRDVASVTVQVKAEHDNYVTATNSYTLNVTPATYTVETYGAEREYNGDPLTAGGRIVGLVNGETATLTCTGRITDVGEVDNTYTLTWNGTAVESNYTHGTDTIGKLKVTQNSTGLTVSGTDYSGTYDGKMHGEAAKANVIAGTTISYSTDGGTIWTVDHPTVRDAASVTVQVKAENRNYVTAVNQYTLTVLPKKVTITVNNSEKDYARTDPVFTGTVEGLVREGDLGVVTYYRTNSTVEASGTYVGVLSVRYTENRNYEVTVKPGTFVIIPGKTMVIAVRDVTAYYDGRSHGIQPTVTTAEGEAITEGTTLTYSTDGGTTYSSQLPQLTNAGTLHVLVKAVNPNYEPASAEFTILVRPAEVTVTAVSGEKIYGDSDPAAFETVVEGMVNGDDPARKLRFTVDRAPGENADTYAITVTGTADQGNYHVTFVPGSFVIHPRTIALKWSIRNVSDGSAAGSSHSVVYDGTNKTAEAVITNLVSWNGTTDKVTIVGYSGDTNVRNAGSFKTQVTGLSGKDAANYVLDEKQYQWAITPKPIADTNQPDGYAAGIKVSSIGDYVYDGQWHFPIPEVLDEKVGGGVILKKDVDYQLLYRDHHDAGTATVRIVGIGNYKLAIEKTFPIRPRSVILYWDKHEFDYDSQPKRVLATVVNALEGDEVYVSGYRDNVKSDSGSYTARAVWLSGESAGNYTLLGSKSAAHSWVIHPARLIIRADDKTSQVGEPLQELTYTVIGTLYGNDVPGILRLATTAKDAAGTFPITITIGKANPNYILSTENGTYTLTAPTVLPTQPTEETNPAEPENVRQETQCLWHWLIVLADLIFAVILLLTMKREEAALPMEERAKRAKRSRIRRLLGLAALILVCIAVNILGSCRLELLLSILSVIWMAAASALLYRRKFAQSEDAQLAGNA